MDGVRRKMAWRNARCLADDPHSKAYRIVGMTGKPRKCLDMMHLSLRPVTLTAAGKRFTIPPVSNRFILKYRSEGQPSHGYPSSLCRHRSLYAP